ncbi:hypothetical protein Gorai_014803, partial [Gossypium raimondii]|nr:hypothetical protein [Gossypium raimondii]
TLQEDSIIWRSEEFGVFSVHSGVEIVIWKPSENAFIKINFDEGFSSPFLEIMFEDCYQKSKGSYSGRRWRRKIDGERLGGVPLDCEMKIGFKVLLGYSPIKENSSEG